MSSVELKYTLPGPDFPGSRADVILTYDPDSVNPDGSYTVIDARGTYELFDENGNSATYNVIGITPVGDDGNDNEIFLNQAPIVTDSGIGFVIDDPDASNDGQGNVDFYSGTYGGIHYSEFRQTHAVTYNPTLTPYCFCPGTLIRTPAGDVQVEKLQAGDLVCTADGGQEPIRWIGRQRVATRFTDPLRTMPVRIKAGALDENVPVRDLLLSPCHAVLVDGILVQAGALVNGSTVAREARMPETFTYYHVEVASHALIYAEGAQAETFVDNAGRLAFDNWAEYQAVAGDAEPVAEMGLPRAKSHRQVPQAIRARLATRAGARAEAA